MPRLRSLALAAILAVAGASLPGQATPPSSRTPEWTRGATCYEVFVRSFHDSDGDGVGDLAGLTERLDYINDGNPRGGRDLGARCIWLMPVAESPSYHGYDVVDYYRVDREYGTNADFKRFVAAAHRRGIRVLVDMVINHASSDHPWFQSAARDPQSAYRSWFRWAPFPGPLNRWGASNWHRSPADGAYYYGFFWSGMPDLNYDTPAVLEEMKRIAAFWVEEMGVDGFRLDAVRHLHERGDQTENVTETHAVLREYGAHVRGLRPGTFTIGEVWEPIDVMMRYYPDQLDAYFAFEVADSLIAGVRNGSAQGVLAPVLALQRRLPAGRWAPFLRNHDQPRTRTELGGSMAKARVASALLLTLPGLPFVYYGEEIGMTGTKPDERLRTPMQWSAARGAGFSTGRPWQRLQDDSLAITVEAQHGDPASLLNLHRALIHLRAAHPALGGDTLVPVAASDGGVLAYTRREGARAVLVVANLRATAAEGVTLTLPAAALPPGRWAPRDVLGPARGDPLVVAPAGGAQRYRPLRSLAPLTVYVFDLVARGAPPRSAPPR